MLYQLVLEVQQWQEHLVCCSTQLLRAPHGGVFVIPVVTHPFAIYISYSCRCFGWNDALALLKNH